MTNYTWIDFLFFAFFFISILAGIMRGLIKEVISLITWIVALIIASMLATRLSDIFTNNETIRGYIVSFSNFIGVDASHPISLVSIGISFFCIFALALVAGGIVNFFFNKIVSASGIGIINRLFGAAFGLIRGYLICVVLVFLVQLTSFQSDPSWTQSKLVIRFQAAAVRLGDFVQPGIENLRNRAGDTIQTLGLLFQKNSF